MDSEKREFWSKIDTYIDEYNINLIRNLSELQQKLFEKNTRKKFGFIEIHDYIYSFDKMVNFSGKKLQKRRNLKNNFTKKYGDKIVCCNYNYDLHHNELEIFITEWCENYLKGSNSYEAFTLINLTKLINIFKKNIECCLYFIEDKIVAFIVGEIVDEDIIIHLHHCKREYKGIYQFTVSDFLSRLQKNIKYELKQVNFLDDGLSNNLKIAKQQYRPIKYYNKAFFYTKLDL